MSKWKDSYEYVDLLQKIKFELIDMWKVADESLADVINEFETSLKFVEYALKTLNRNDIQKALIKSLPLIEQETDFEDQNQIELVNEIKKELYYL